MEVEARSNHTPSRYVREGDPRVEAIRLIGEQPDISILVPGTPGDKQINAITRAGRPLVLTRARRRSM